MSRGLGRHQRDVLVEMLAIERAGKATRLGTIAVRAIVNRLWDRKWKAEHDVAHAKLAAARDAEMAQMRALAAAGDAEAAKWVADTEDCTRMIESAAAILRSRGRRHWGPTRASWTIEKHINPSRILALLERRKLVERGWLKVQGNGSAVRFTDAGREMARRLTPSTEPPQ
ncbi:MAG: hypothetical protein AB7P02_15730 [Alphaproteobacteria bacterium]